MILEMRPRCVKAPRAPLRTSPKRARPQAHTSARVGTCAVVSAPTTTDLPVSSPRGLADKCAALSGARRRAVVEYVKAKWDQGDIASFAQRLPA
jgi:hypothetical protein